MNGLPLLQCQTCGHNYNTTDRVPYHLPCDKYHWLCRTCITDTMHKTHSIVVCPYCCEKHSAYSGVNSFHIHTGLLRIARKRERYEFRTALREKGIDPDTIVYKKCSTHNKPVLFFCFGSRCQVALCRSCVVEHQNKNLNAWHNYQEIREHVRATIRFKVNRGLYFLERTLRHPNRDWINRSMFVFTCFSQMNNFSGNLLIPIELVFSINHNVAFIV